MHLQPLHLTLSGHLARKLRGMQIHTPIMCLLKSVMVAECMSDDLRTLRQQLQLQLPVMPFIRLTKPRESARYLLRLP